MKGAVATGVIASLSGMIAGAAVASAYLLKMNEVGAVLLTGLAAVLVSFIATCVSIYTLITGSFSGRVTATMNFIITQQNDSDLMQAKQVVARAISQGDVAAWADGSRVHTAEHLAISHVLNGLEFAAVAIDVGAFDLQLFKRWQEHHTVKMWRDLEPFVAKTRARLMAPKLWETLEALVNEIDTTRPGYRPRRRWKLGAS